jgi:hypothetical protein
MRVLAVVAALTRAVVTLADFEAVDTAPLRLVLGMVAAALAFREVARRARRP